MSGCWKRISRRVSTRSTTPAPLERVRGRVSDKKVLSLVKAFLKAGVLGEDGVDRDTWTGTPQGGILSPLLANVALSALDDHFIEVWAGFGKNPQARSYRPPKGFRHLPAGPLCGRFRRVGARHPPRRCAATGRGYSGIVGDRAAPEQREMRGVHINKGFDFLGSHIERDRKRRSSKAYIHTYP